MTSVTIILTTLNGERYLARSIDSCLAQTHDDFELLIVDGGSTDSTLEIIAKYDDPRIRVIHQPDNSGKLPGALNLGMANAAGAFITWTQDDSWYEPNAVESMVTYLESHPETALVYTDFWIVDESGHRIRYEHVRTPRYDQMLQADVIGQCFLFRRHVYEVVDPQKEEYFPVHEIPWRVEVFKRFKIEPLHRPLLSYTSHSQSLTGRIGGWELMRMMAVSLYREGYLEKDAVRIRLAQIDVDEGYERYIIHGDFRTFRRLALSGIRRNPRHLGNLGLLKNIAFSLSPIRHHYRGKLLSCWEADRAAEQSQIIAQYAKLPLHEGL